MDYPFSLYKPSKRFAQLSQSELAEDMWHCITHPERVESILESVTKGDPAVASVDSELHQRFSARILKSSEDEDELRTLCMNMIKQLLEHLGYEHVGCALRSSGEFVKSAGIFQKCVG